MFKYNPSINSDCCYIVHISNSYYKFKAVKIPHQKFDQYVTSYITEFAS